MYVVCCLQASLEILRWKRKIYLRLSKIICFTGYIVNIITHKSRLKNVLDLSWTVMLNSNKAKLGYLAVGSIRQPCDVNKVTKEYCSTHKLNTGSWFPAHTLFTLTKIAKDTASWMLPHLQKHLQVDDFTWNPDKQIHFVYFHEMTQVT